MRSPRWLWPASVAGVVLLGLAALWASGVLTVKTPHGALVLEDLPENAVVEVDGERKVVVTSADGQRVEIELKPGPHGVVVRHEGVALTADSVTIEAGRDFALKVRRLPAAAPVVAPVEEKARERPTEIVAAPTVDRSRFAVISGQWREVRGELVQKNPSMINHEITFGDDWWTDYDFSVDALRVQGDSPFSLLFRSTAPSNEFEFTVAGAGNKTCYALVRRAGFESTLSSRDFSLRAGDWYTARVHVRGKQMVCSLFDSHNSTETRVIELVDDRHPRGRVGLRTFGSSFRFKNIKVTSPDGRTLWEGLPAVASASAEESSPSDGSPGPVASGSQLIPLFNGRDIAGWTAWGTEGRLTQTEAVRTWWVRDGILHGTGGLSHLFSPRGDYQNFRVRAEVKINDQGNSGIFLRVAERPGHLVGYEVQINSTHRDPNKTGSLYRVPLPPIGVSPSPVPPDTWFTLEARIFGGHIGVWIDGKLTVDWTDPQNMYARGRHRACRRTIPVAMCRSVSSRFRNSVRRGARRRRLGASRGCQRIPGQVLQGVPRSIVVARRPSQMPGSGRTPRCRQEWRP